MVKASWKRDDESRTGTNPQALKRDGENAYCNTTRNERNARSRPWNGIKVTVDRYRDRFTSGNNIPSVVSRLNRCNIDGDYNHHARINELIVSFSLLSCSPLLYLLDMFCFRNNFSSLLLVHPLLYSLLDSTVWCVVVFLEAGPDSARIDSAKCCISAEITLVSRITTRFHWRIF